MRVFAIDSSVKVSSTSTLNVIVDTQILTVDILGFEGLSDKIVDTN